MKETDAGYDSGLQHLIREAGLYVSMEQISKWNERQKVVAAKWAIGIHLERSNNIPKPLFLKDCEAI